MTALQDLLRTSSSREGVRRVLGNFSWLLVDRLLRIAVGLIVGIWIARHLGPGDFGRLNYATALVALFAAIIPLGLDGIVVRELVRDPPGNHRLLLTAIGLRASAVTLSLSLLCGYLLLFPQPGDAVLIITLVVAAGLVLQPLDSLDLYFQSRSEMGRVVVPRSLLFVATSVVKVMLIAKGFDVLWFAALLALESLVASLCVLVVYLRDAGRPAHLGIDWRLGMNLLRQSWPLLLSGVSVMIYMKLGQLMLGMMLGQEQLGAYSAALRVSEAGYFVPMILASSVLPALVKSQDHGPKTYTRRLALYFDASALVAYALAIPSTLFASQIVAVLYGPDYAGAAPMLAVGAWAGIFVFLGVARGQFLINEGLLRFSLLSTLSGVAVNIVANLLLIPVAGGVGCAVATILSQATSAVISSFFHAGTRRIGRLQLRALAAPVYYAVALFRRRLPDPA